MPDTQDAAPLDVPRLERMCESQASTERTLAARAREIEAEGGGSRWLKVASDHETTAAQWSALRAALSGLVEDRALLDRTESWLRDHPHETLELTMNDYNSPGGDIAAIHAGETPRVERRKTDGLATPGYESSSEGKRKTRRRAAPTLAESTAWLSGAAQ